MSAELLFDGRDLTFRYLGRYPALDGVSVEVHAGECLTLLGANGSGKSTLLKVLDGLVFPLFPQDGLLTAFGELLTEEVLGDPAANARFRSRVGLVFQNPEAQLFSASVGEDLGFGCRQLGLSRDETRRRIAEVAELLQIADLLDRAPVHLSVGQQKRAAIGSVLVMGPEVILLDEPTASLDPRTRDWLAGLLRSLRAAGRTLVIATHDLDLAAAVGERCVVLGEDHRVAATGPAADVLADRRLLAAANLVAPA